MLFLNQNGGRLARLQVVQFLPEQGHTLQLLHHTLMAAKPNNLGFLITLRFVTSIELAYILHDLYIPIFLFLLCV
jgi:hypothetical protein